MDAQQAAERAAERWVDQNGRGSLYAIIMSEFAPLLAAKDAEIERIKGAMEILRSDRASVKADRDRLAAEVAELRRDAERWNVVINGMSTREVANYHFAGRLSEMADAAIAAKKV